MDCATYQERINEFIDGELEMRLQVELFQHIATCTSCQTLIDALVRMKEAVRNERVSYPQELDDAILGQILTSTPPAKRTVGNPERFWNRHVAVPLHLAASFTIIILAAGLLFGRMLFPPAELREQSGAFRMGTDHPQAVIMIYGMPPVEVLDTPTVRTLKGTGQHDNWH